MSRRAGDDDFQREIEAHIEHEADRLEAEGMRRPEALAAARRSFGNSTKVREQRWESSRWSLIDPLVSGTRVAIRRLMSSGWPPVITILTLGAAIGASTAIFALVNAVALTPLPYPDPAKIVWFTQVLTKNSTDEVTITPDYLDWRRLVTSFSQIAAFNNQGRIYTADGVARKLPGVRASAEVLPLLGVRPALGRGFARQEDVKGSDRGVLLAHGLWMRDFGSDPAVIGRKITLDDQPYEVIGVLPEGFRFPADQPVEVVTPLGKDEAQELLRGPSVSIVRNVLGRLKPGVTMAAAREELLAIQRNLPQMPWKPKIDILMMPLADRLLRSPRQAGFALLGATLFLLLIACANAANLLLAEGARRERENAVRAAIGGSRARLIFQALVEASLTAWCAAALGVAIAWVSRAALLALIPKGGYEIGSAPIDGRVLGFACLLAAATVLISALGPAIRMSKVAPAEAIKRGPAAHTGSAFTRRLLLAVASLEIALTMTLLAASALLMQSFLKMRYAGLGFLPDRLVVAAFTPRAKDTPQRLLESIRGAPGIESAAIGESSALPPGYATFENNFCVQGWPVPPHGSRKTARVQTVAGQYFAVLGIPVLKGRATLEAGPERPAAMSQALAQRLFGSADPIGHRIGPCGGPPDWRTVTGIVADARTSGLGGPPESLVYVPAGQSGGYSEAALVVKTSLPFEFAAAEIRGRIASIDPRQPVTSVQKMAERLDDSAGQPRFVSILASVFALAALLLSVTGTYSVMACFARWRTREFAVRSALGASRWDLLAAQLSQGAVSAGSGILAGAAGTIVLTKLLGAFLREVDPRDPVTIGAVAALLGAMALAGCLIPARRAASADPATVLRVE